MVDYREILRQNSLNASQRAIAQSVKSSHHTIREVLETAAAKRIHWPLVIIPPVPYHQSTV